MNDCDAAIVLVLALVDMGQGVPASLALPPVPVVRVDVRYQFVPASLDLSQRVLVLKVTPVIGGVSSRPLLEDLVSVSMTTATSVAFRDETEDRHVVGAAP